MLWVVCSRVVRAVFGAKGQIAFGVLILLAVVAQWVYWTVVPPSVSTVFTVSMEAFVVAAYAIIATGLGYLATERVEAHVRPDDADN